MAARRMNLGGWLHASGGCWRSSRPFDMRPVISGTQSKLRDLLPIAEAAGPIAARARARAGPASLARTRPMRWRPWRPSSARAWSCWCGACRRSHGCCAPRPRPATRCGTYSHRRSAGLLWPVPWPKEMARFYEALGERHLRSATFFLLIWDLPELQADTLLASLEHTTGRRASLCESLPPTLTAEYTVDERQARLVPQVPGQPYLAVLRSYDMNGTWDATTLHTLLALDFDVALALDVTTFSQGRVIRSSSWPNAPPRACCATVRTTRWRCVSCTRPARVCTGSIPRACTICRLPCW